METTEGTAKKPQKGRLPWEKYGKYCYMYKLLHELQREMNARFDDVEAKLNMLMVGLSDWLTSEKDYVVSVVCKDEVDQALLWCLHTVGGVGTSIEEGLELLSKVGLNDAFIFVRRYDQLSDGQRYRYRIAKLIESGRQYWVMDEFCATLDRDTAKIVAFNVQKLARARATVEKDSLEKLVGMLKALSFLAQTKVYLLWKKFC